MADLSVRWGNGGFQEIEGILVMGGGGGWYPFTDYDNVVRKLLHFL